MSNEFKLSPAQQADILQSYPIRHLHRYDALLKGTARGRSVRRRLQADPRIKSLRGQMVQSGASGIGFEIDRLAMWYLWLEDRLDHAAAAHALEAFLTQPRQPVLLSHWVLGLRVTATIPLGEGFELRPLAAMPDSAEKELFTRGVLSGFWLDHLLPSCAIVKSCPIKVVANIEALRQPDPTMRTIQRQLNILPLLLNAIEGVSCLPHYFTSYLPDTMPFGPFSSGGGCRPRHDVIGSQTDEFKPPMAGLLRELFGHYEAKPEPEKQRLQLILLRLCQAKRHERIEDKVLDLGIALEMLLLNDNDARTQLAHSFRLRGSWLLAKDAAERPQLFVVLRDLYDARSQVAHTGRLRLKGSSMREIQGRLDQWLNLGCRVLQRIILRGTPDWTQLVLGG